MSEIPALTPEPGFIVRRRWLPVLFIVLVISAICVGVTGIYFGSTLTERKWKAKEDRWERDKLDYEQRLGTQSAQFAKQLTKCQDTLQPLVGGQQQTIEKLQPLADGLAQTQSDLRALSDRFSRATAQRDKANTEALKTAKETQQKADALAVQIDRQQRTLIPKIDAAASAAQATEKKLETATHPTAVVPATPWAGNR